MIRRTCRGALAVLLAVVALAPLRAQAAAKLPERSIDVREPAMTGRVLRVSEGGDLQSAINKAAPGDVISLDPRGVYEPILLPRKKGNGWITIRSSATLPPAGTRVKPSDARLMPKLIADAGPAISAVPGAAHYRFVGIEIRPPDGQFSLVLVELGLNEVPTDQLPHDIIFASCYLHGDPIAGSRRGIALNGQSMAVVDSYLSDFKEQGNDSQAIAGWSGPGPFLIANNYLEGAGENVIFGGGDAPGPDRIPSDIEIRGNTFDKPLAWKQGSPGFTVQWTVKNILELKDARRVLIENNVLTHNWAQAQSGFAVLFTVRNQDGDAPFSMVQDVTFQGNLVRSTGSALNILGRDDNHPSEQTQRIDIRNNLFEDISASWGGKGTLFQVLQGPKDVTIEHNTGLQTGNVLFAEGLPALGFVFKDNVVVHNQNGIIGTSTAPGQQTLMTYFPGAAVEGNVFIGGDAKAYPAGNKFAPNLDAVFTDPERRHARPAFAGAGATSSPSASR